MTRAAQSWALEVSVGAACALVVFTGLNLSATAPRQRQAVEVLEAQVAAQPKIRPPRAALEDQRAARSLCIGSLARAVGELERFAPQRAEKAGLGHLQMQFGSPTAQGGFFMAPATLTFEGAMPRLGDQLTRSNTVAPSLFLDQVLIVPGPGGRGDTLVKMTGRVVCARP